MDNANYKIYNKKWTVNLDRECKIGMWSPHFKLVSRQVGSSTFTEVIVKIHCSGQELLAVPVYSWKNSAVWSACRGVDVPYSPLKWAVLCSILFSPTTCIGSRAVPSTEPTVSISLSSLVSGVPGFNAAAPIDECKEHCTCNNRLIKICNILLHTSKDLTFHRKFSLSLSIYSLSSTTPIQSFIQVYSWVPLTVHPLQFFPKDGNVVSVRLVPPKVHEHLLCLGHITRKLPLPHQSTNQSPVLAVISPPIHPTNSKSSENYRWQDSKLYWKSDVYSVKRNREYSPLWCSYAADHMLSHIISVVQTMVCLSGSQ